MKCEDCLHRAYSYDVNDYICEKYLYLQDECVDYECIDL